MKKVVLIFIAASAMLISCNNSATTTSTESGANNEAPVKGASITFQKNNYDFGKIPEGQKVTHEFEFVNNGSEPLIISNATASCGCTIPEYPKEPIAPGKKGVIKVVFDSSGRPGMQNKIVSVTSNANPSLTEIYLTGEVMAKAAAAK